MHQTLSVNRAGAMFDVCDLDFGAAPGSCCYAIPFGFLWHYEKLSYKIYPYPILKNVSEILLTYRKIPKISPGAYIFQRPFLRDLFLEGLIFGGAYLRREICVSKSIELAI